MIDTQNLNERAYYIVRELVLNDELNPGMIYSETKLSEAIGVSRTPLRDAIHKLESEGFLDVIPSKGFKIHVLTPDEISDSFEQRCAIEGLAIFKLCENISSKTEHDTFELLKSAVKKQEDSYHSGQPASKSIIFDHEFHQTLVNYLQNENFNNFFEKHLYQILKHCASAVEGTDNEENMIIQHKAIIKAVENHDSYNAYKAMLIHLEEARKINYLQAVENSRLNSILA